MDADGLDMLLRPLAEPEYKEFSSKLLPGVDGIIGVRIPALRRIAKDICRSDWKNFLSYEPQSFEHTMIYGLVTATAPMTAGERIKMTEKFIPMINNWSVSDTFCASWKIGKTDDKDEVWNYCTELVRRHSEFPSRVGAVMMLDHFIDDEHVDLINRILCSAAPCGRYYDMGAAWTLSVCYVKYPDRTEQALFGGTADLGILKKTVQKICDSYRVGKEDKERLRIRLKAVAPKSSESPRI